jgi:predicted amidophosphoribosyltransferase
MRIIKLEKMSFEYKHCKICIDCHKKYGSDTLIDNGRCPKCIIELGRETQKARQKIQNQANSEPAGEM